MAIGNSVTVVRAIGTLGIIGNLLNWILSLMSNCWHVLQLLQQLKSAVADKLKDKTEIE